MNGYQDKVSQQIEQYAAGYDEFPIPEMFHYWSHTYVRERVVRIFGTETTTDFYANQFSELFLSCERPNIVSFGSGDAAQEIQIAQALLAMGRSNFRFLCLDLIPESVARANRSAVAAGVSEVLSSRVFDVNLDDLPIQIDGAMAHQSLHHFVELERTFDLIARQMPDHGMFLTQDMIGRNGHMRWPEVLNFVESIWRDLPDQKKYNHITKRIYPNFINFDCSKEGFEGIRAQDILPLLVERFDFSGFVGEGGVIEVFLDRSFGHNFRSNNEVDRQFVDALELFNSALLSAGKIKPTMMIARMGKIGKCPPTKSCNGITPTRSIRSC